MNPIVKAILSTPPARVEALVILHEFLAGPELPDPRELIRQNERVERAMDELKQLGKRSEKVVKLCLQAKAVPAKQTPLGF